MGKSDDGVKKSGKRVKEKRRSSSSSESSWASIDEQLKEKLLKKLKKFKKKEKKKKKKRSREKERQTKSNVNENKNKGKKYSKESIVEENKTSSDQSKKFAPMTKEEWEKQQNTLRRVYDEETGRTRLVRGSGEIVEECVSRERQLAINKHATLKDGRTYIGFTTDPNRRIKQHNRGKEFGGAWRTSARGPWEMVLTVHGFPSDVSALRFEWAWQHPKKSRRLKSIVSNKKSSETSVEFNIRIMFTMLSTPPWNRLPLTIQWLSADVVIDPPPNMTPPTHIPVTYGSVVSKRVKHSKSSHDIEETMKPETENGNSVSCQLCETAINENDLLTCMNSHCKESWHMFCLADNFLVEEQFSSNAIGEPVEKERKRILPLEGSCPNCKSIVLWGDLIRKKQGCFSDVINMNESCSSDS